MKRTIPLSCLSAKYEAKAKSYLRLAQELNTRKTVGLAPSKGKKNQHLYQHLSRLLLNSRFLSFFLIFAQLFNPYKKGGISFINMWDYFLAGSSDFLGSPLASSQLRKSGT